MAKLLSERESAVLRIILASSEPRVMMANGTNITRALERDYGLETSPAGAHRTAASLCRKNLAWRAGTPVLQWYKITQPGRDAITGDPAGQWVVR